MKRLLLLFVFLALFAKFHVHAQTPFSVIASNRIVQLYHNPAELEKIRKLDSNRVQVLWNYLSASFAFESDDDLSLTELLNILHFNVHDYENQRAQDHSVQLFFKGTTSITLISGNELNALLDGYGLDELLYSIPSRPFPLWTTETYSDIDFGNYKHAVWEWARDYPAEYLELTSDVSVMHIRFSDWQAMDTYRRQTILNDQNYLIVD